MGIVAYNMSMSLDGYVAADGRSPAEPMGVGGLRLHEWAFESVDERSAAWQRSITDRIGAMITGRQTYDDSLKYWGVDGPTPDLRLPVYVVTHRDDAPPEGSVYHFVTDGVDSAVHQARAAAGDKDVAVSGVDIGRQLLHGGYLDELWLAVVPVMFGAGDRLYDQKGAHFELELVEAIPTPKAVHLHYRVQRGQLIYQVR